MTRTNSNQQSPHIGHLPSSGRALKISAWLTGIYFVIEFAIGMWMGSIAVISDAFHTFSAVGGVLVAIIASRLAKLPADERFTFGWYRAEIIGALVNGAFLAIMAVVVIVMGLMRLSEPIDLPTGPMLLVAAGGLLTEIVSVFLLFKQQKTDINVRGAYWHILQTFVGSFIIIIAAVVIKYTGFLQIDPLLGIAFGFVLLWASWGILRDSIRLLLDGTPDEISLAEVSKALGDISGVFDIHHVHAWALTSGKYVFSAHLRLSPKAVKRQAKILTNAHRILKRQYGFYFVTLQIETRCMDEASASPIDVVSISNNKKGKVHETGSN